MLRALAVGGLLILAFNVTLIVSLAWISMWEWIDDRGRCICRKGAWHPDCPVHGRQAGTEDPAKLREERGA